MLHPTTEAPRSWGAGLTPRGSTQVRPASDVGRPHFEEITALAGVPYFREPNLRDSLTGGRPVARLRESCSHGLPSLTAQPDGTRPDQRFVIFELHIIIG
jgi:hypothetical protein